MKKLKLILFLLFISFSGFTQVVDYITAGNYAVTTRGNKDSLMYFSQGGKITSKTGTSQGDRVFYVRKESSIDTINSFPLNANDLVLFERNGKWYGTITVPVNNINYGSWGTGQLPTISGFTTISGWTSEGNGIYSKTISGDSNPEIVTVNNVQYAQGRTPNSNRYSPNYSDFYHIDTYTATSITDTECNSATTDWDGAEIIVRGSGLMTYHKFVITSHSGTTLNYSNPESYSLAAGYGYFIQNDIRTLNQFGEWFYGGGKFYMYFGGANPDNYTVKLSTKDYLINVNTRDFITIKNLQFEGANSRAVTTNTASSLAYNLKVNNCKFLFNMYGIYAHEAPEPTVTRCTFINTSKTPMYLHWYCDGAYVARNTIDSTGLVVGPGITTGVNSNFYIGMGMYVNYCKTTHSSKKMIVEYNSVKNSAYSGIVFAGDSAKIRYNYVAKSCVNKADGGSIYYGGQDVFSNMSIYGNIVVDNSFNSDVTGLLINTTADVNGIYSDYKTISGMNIYDNSVSNISGNGIYAHMNQYSKIENNNIFNCKVGVKIQELETYNLPTRNITMTGNIIVAKTVHQLALSARSLTNDFNQFGTINNNKYGYKITGSLNFATLLASWTLNYKTLSDWQTYSSQDATSTATGITAEVDSMYFYYNPTNKDSVVNLATGTLKDINNTSYTTSITLPAWKSKILWKPGTPNLTGTFAAYHLEESSGSVLDAAGAHNGTGTGIVTRVTGKVNFAYDFDSGTADRFSVPYNSVFPASESRTIRMWVNFDNLPSTVGNVAILSLEFLANFNTKFLIGVNTSNYLYVTVFNGFNTGKTYTADKKTITQTGTWYHIAVTIPNISGGEYPTVYLNGENVCTNVALHAGATRTSDSYFYIGAYSGSTQAPDAKIDEFNYWGKRLRPADVWDDYNNTRTYPF